MVLNWSAAATIWKVRPVDWTRVFSPADASVLAKPSATKTLVTPTARSGAAPVLAKKRVTGALVTMPVSAVLEALE